MRSFPRKMDSPKEYIIPHQVWRAKNILLQSMKDNMYANNVERLPTLLLTKAQNGDNTKTQKAKISVARGLQHPIYFRIRLMDLLCPTSALRPTTQRSKTFSACRVGPCIQTANGPGWVSLMLFSCRVRT